MREDALWRPDIDSLAFLPTLHGGQCVVHRLAFRKLLGGSATPEACLAFFRLHRGAFDEAARAKTIRMGLAAAANFHLTSRDLRRVLGGV